MSQSDQNQTLQTTPSQFIGQQHAYIDTYIVDVVTLEHYDYESTITNYPREDGSSGASGGGGVNVTDNIRPLPYRIKMTCIVSNTPTDDTVIAARNAVQGVAESMFSTYFDLQRIYYLRKLVTITSSLGTYKDMAMKHLSIPRSADQGDALFFDIEFQHVITVKSTRGGKRVASPSGTAPHTVTAAPTPLKAVPTTLGQLIFANDTENGTFAFLTWYWYDSDIGGWRQTATLSSDGSYFLIGKGRPFGAANAEFQANPSDTYWQQKIQNEQTVETNPFNPWVQAIRPSKRLTAPVRTNDPWSY